jgi:hypothetical protein
MFDKQGLQSDDLLLFEQYRLSNLLSSFDSFTEVIYLKKNYFLTIILFFFNR